MKKTIPLLLAIVLTLSLLTGCGGTYTDSGNTNEPKSGESPVPDAAPLRRANSKQGYGSVTIVYTEPNTLNLLTSQSNLDLDVLYLASAMLYRPYADKVIPDLAQSCDASEDGRTYTYQLRAASYVDGTPITAADFVYYILNSNWSRTSNILDCLVNGKAFMAGECDASEVGVRAEDDHTLVVELAEDAAGFVPEMEIYPVNQAYAESKGDAFGGTAADFLCSGPYVLTDWTFGASLSFEKNPDYWDAENSFQIAQVKVLHGVDSNAQYNMFTAGEADILQSIGDEVQTLIPDQCVYRKSGAIQGLEFNTTGFFFDGTTFAPKDPAVSALLANRNFRLALTYALNREAIVMAADPVSVGTNRYFGFARTSDGASFADTFAVTVAPVTGDEMLAQEYLAKALEELGYNDVSDLPTVKYLTFENAKYRLMAETLQSEWKRVLGITNIEIELKPIQDAIMSMVYMDYDIYYQATSVEPAKTLMIMKYWITGGGMSDLMGAGAPISSIYANPEFDNLIAQASTEFDGAKRDALVAQGEEMFLNSYVFVPILEQGTYAAISNRVSGYVTSDAVSGLMLNYATVND